MPERKNCRKKQFVLTAADLKNAIRRVLYIQEGIASGDSRSTTKPSLESERMEAPFFWGTKKQKG